MRIRKHEKSHIVELEDGSAWRIWPADLAIPLHWMPSTRLDVCEMRPGWHSEHLDKLRGSSRREAARCSAALSWSCFIW